MRTMIHMLVLLVCLSTPAFATTYYISSSTGNDANPGTDPAYPFRTPAAVSGINFVKPGDSVLFKRGDTWLGADAAFTFRSAGTAADPINLNAYGACSANQKYWINNFCINNPVFIGSEIYTGGWTKDLMRDPGGNIWKTSVPFFNQPVYMVSIDEKDVAYLAQSLSQLQNPVHRGAPTALFLKNITNSADPDCNRVFIRMADGSDPNKHKIRIGHYSNGTYGALIQIGDATGNAPYVIVRNFHVKWANRVGIQIHSGHCQIADTLIEFTGGETVAAVRNGINPPSNGADYTQLIRVTGLYGAVGGSGIGQNMTIASDRSWAKHVYSGYGGKAGFDFLDYNGNTVVSYSGLLSSKVDTNSQEPHPYFADPGVYVDGAHHVLLYNNIVTGHGTRNNTLRASGISTATENVMKPNTDVYIINNFSYNNNGDDIAAAMINNIQTDDGIHLYNNTFLKSANIDGTQTQADFRMSRSGTEGLHLRNNVFYHAINLAYNLVNTFDIPNSGYLDSDYNVWFKKYYAPVFARVILVPSIANYTFPGYQTLLNSEPHSVLLDPLLVNAAYDEADPRLQRIAEGYAADSPAIDAGSTDYYAELPVWVAQAIGLPNPISGGTTRMDGIPDDTESLPDAGHHSMPYIGDLVSARVVPQNLTAGGQGNVLVAFYNYLPIPNDSRIVITFPADLGNFSFNRGGRTAVMAATGLPGGFMITNISGNKITLKKYGWATLGPGDKSFVLTNIGNPDAAGTTGFFSIQIQNGTTSYPIEQDGTVGAVTLTAPAAA